MSIMIKAEEVAELCNVSAGKAYKIIQELNQEIQKKGYLTIRGRVNKDYLLDRLGMSKGE